MKLPKWFTDRWNFSGGFFDEMKQLWGLVHSILSEAEERLLTGLCEGETPKTCSQMLKYTKAKLRAQES